MSLIKTNIQIVSFGHAVITLEPAITQLEPEETELDKREIYYHQPTETGSFHYEILYESQEITYTVPYLTTNSTS
jgi:hypothetical protein